MIAQWQIEQFHQQGFLVVEEVLSAEESRCCRPILTPGSKRADSIAKFGAKPWMVGRVSTSKATTRPIIPRCAG